MTPRVPPLRRSEIAPDLLLLPAFQRSGHDEPFNIYRTMAHHPKLLRQWMVFSEGIRFEGLLPARDRELLILRTGWNCRSEYEWGRHVGFARQAGITDEEIHRLCCPLDQQEWSAGDMALLAAADELHQRSTISETPWGILRETYSEAQIVEICLLVGHYHGVSYLLNATAAEWDDGMEGFPDRL